MWLRVGQAGVAGAYKCLTPEQAEPMEEAFADIVDTCIERVQQEATNPRIDQHTLIVAEMALTNYMNQFTFMVSYFQDMPCLPCPFLVGNITKLTASVTAQLAADYPTVRVALVSCPPPYSPWPYLVASGLGHACVRWGGGGIGGWQWQSDAVFAPLEVLFTQTTALIDKTCGTTTGRR